MRFNVLLIAILGIALNCSAQVKEQSAWMASFNSVKLSKKWGLHFDFQLRSSDDADYLRNLLVRPGFTYFINERQNATVGYAWVETFANPDISNATNLTEHRIWEQYILSYRIKRASLTHRFRLEQRFVERPGGDVFSQRLRYFVRGIVPLTKQAPFAKGAFIALQNEVFVHLQNNDKFNNKFFDQNRALLALGYRFGKKFDVEAGYLNQFVDGLNNDVSNSAAQINFYTRF